MKRPAFFSANSCHRGFTFLELAVALALLGMVLGGGLLVVGKWWEGDRREQTRSDLQKAKQAILNYARSNGRLPIADVTGYLHPSDGRSDLPDVEYFNNEGLFQWTNPPIKPDRLAEYGKNYYYGLPYLDLNLAKKDAFGQQLLYKPNYNLTDAREINCKTLTRIFKGEIILDRDYLIYSDGITNRSVYPMMYDGTSRGFGVAAVLASPGEHNYTDSVSGDYNRYDHNPFKGNSNNREASDWRNAANVNYFERMGKVENQFDDIVVYITYTEVYQALNCGELTDDHVSY